MPDKNRTFYNHLLNQGLYSGFAFWSSLNDSKFEPLNVLANKVSSQLKELAEENRQIEAFGIIANNLMAMSNNERMKEQAWLNSLGLKNLVIDYSDPKNAQTIIKALNSIIGTKGELERIATLVQKDAPKDRDITKYAISYDGQGYIQKAMDNHISELVSNTDFVQGVADFFKDRGNLDKAAEAYKKWAIDCFTEGILEMLEAGILKKGDAQTYSDLLSQIKIAQDKIDPLVRDEFLKAAGLDRLIGIMKEYLAERKESGRKNVSENLVRNTVTNGIKKLGSGEKKWTGDLREALEAIIGNYVHDKEVFVGNGQFLQLDIKFIAKKVGQAFFKTDVYMGFGLSQAEMDKILENDKKSTVNKTTRTKAWEYSKQVQKKLNQFPNAFLIEETVKSYKDKTLKMNDEKHYGFSAGEYTGASGLNLLYKIHKDNSDITKLYDTIINLGEGMIGENRDDIKESIEIQLAQDIGHALFDDHESIGVAPVAGTGTMLHVLLLNGTRIFLSFFYYLLAEAFSQLGKDMGYTDFREYVSVKANPAGRFDGDGTTLDQSVWIEQKKYSRDNTSIEMHFLHSFNQLVENYIYKQGV